eukprot:767433-Hanusia_phi.AAC.2
MMDCLQPACHPEPQLCWRHQPSDLSPRLPDPSCKSRHDSMPCYLFVIVVMIVVGLMKKEMKIVVV